MPQRHLIALDLDGTLLTDNKTISMKTKQTIQKAREAGHIVVISTGRPYRASIQYYQELQLDTAIVNFNGAFVHHPKDSSFGTYHHPLELSTARQVIETCEAFDVSNIMVEVIDDYYLRYYDELFIQTFTEGQGPVEHGNLLKKLRDDPTCVLIHPKDDHVSELRSLLDGAHAEVIDQRTWGAPWNVIEIVKAGMNKAVGLKRIADYYQVPKERIIAFGDEDNDFEMIEYAGKGVAMANAIDPLKALANDITLSNEDDGIAVYLEEALNL
ncbi:Cof-type HAD-IIB family hydrolase [Halalkalibacterium halodurans]|jgi:Cof subfamily protein (haloacid dehalogenase superfamily)|uniref:BH2906 protein n=2 Tax=Halalkalibacterium halodurans TaxID=86665 RepID=Q9K8U6_HALH5|nr:Cof-type HAD-IIB family hydrolase [Halalkalibacterium halodurans]MDY7223458.1 Cof-type HAD-IIB family hydrolase [Halalkalibacterium halodurans]MDY7242679.1 Cof-type HAD-IIB family hydrolase [Halalkalibacterium halodurans]MED4081614.1 Cof-type HAD-IIB family hydrolase [Halalkalibacterium halodurans]MED4084974.1 Cof-type HAD-IIB family hydrolase [Halalkalibacterium halodurans]MED4104139.1 Cof-type HAD-IIB family hydrolase [Halalkalibacterium halodurans]